MKEGELPRFREVLATAFGGGDVGSDWDTAWDKVFEHDRLFVAADGDDIVGVGGSFSFTMTVPGAEVAAAGLTVVGVLPTHRRKGILTALMRFQLDDARNHDEPVSILWASEEIIYQRYGYGLANEHMTVAVDKGHGIFRSDPGPSGRLRLIDEEESLKVLPDLFERVRRATPGMLVRSPEWWEHHRLHDPKSDREGASHIYRLVWEDEGQPEGYALYRVKEGWDERDGLPQGEVRLLELVSATSDAHRELWRYLFAMDLVTTVTGYFVATDDPLPLMVLKPRQLKRRTLDGMWLRVVDVTAALQGRRYEADDSITLEVTDGFCTWNQGRWTLTTRDGAGSVAPSDGDADVAMDIGDLGAVYLGGTTFDQLVRSGRATAATPEAIRRADALFRSDRAPWNPEIF